MTYIWITGVAGEKYREALNSKILAINGINIDEIFQRYCAFKGHDNIYHAGSCFAVRVKFPDINFGAEQYLTTI